MRSLQQDRGGTTNVNHVFVVMGVSGTGKSTVAKMVAQKFDAALLDSDFLHSRADIMKMSGGRPLNDEDRKPWLAALNDAIFAMQRSEAVSLLICSALKRRYRDILRHNNKNLSFIYLKGDFSLIEKRMKNRRGHFFTAEMLESQFQALEEPGPEETDVYTVDVAASVDIIVSDIKRIMEIVLNRRGEPAGRTEMQPPVSGM